MVELKGPPALEPPLSTEDQVEDLIEKSCHHEIQQISRTRRRSRRLPSLYLWPCWQRQSGEAATTVASGGGNNNDAHQQPASRISDEHNLVGKQVANVS